MPESDDRSVVAVTHTVPWLSPQSRPDSHFSVRGHFPESVDKLWPFRRPADDGDDSVERLSHDSVPPVRRSGLVLSGPQSVAATVEPTLEMIWSDTWNMLRDKLWPMPKHGSMLLYVHTETVRLIKTESPGRPPRLSHTGSAARRNRQLSLSDGGRSGRSLHWVLLLGWGYVPCRIFVRVMCMYTCFLFLWYCLFCPVVCSFQSVNYDRNPLGRSLQAFKGKQLSLFVQSNLPLRVLC